MARFFEFIPYGSEIPDIYHISGSVVRQAWEELCLLRHTHSNISNSVYPETAPLVDQAKSYFGTAIEAEWRAASLVYYYSFLNLAKALLGIRGALTHDDLRKRALHHGLSTEPQSAPDLLDLTFSIHPPRSTEGAPHNVFALLYETITGGKWPFQSRCTVRVKEITGHCIDISTALSNMYGVTPQVIAVESLGRSDGNNVWLEMLVPRDFAGKIITNNKWESNVIRPESIGKETKATWFDAYGTPAFAFDKDQSVIQFETVSIHENGEEYAKSVVTDKANRAFKGKVEVPVYDDGPRWHYIEKLRLSGQELVWHPLLSDYLFAFVLATVARYQPFLLVPGEKSYALGESWCNQSPITVLRYFLMLFKKPSMRLKSVG